MITAINIKGRAMSPEEMTDHIKLFLCMYQSGLFVIFWPVDEALMWAWGVTLIQTWYPD